LILEASLAKKLSFVQYPDDGFLTMLGPDGEFYVPPLNEEDRVRDSTLEKDILIIPIVLGGSASTSFRGQLAGIALVGRKCPMSFLHGAPLYGGSATLSVTGNGQDCGDGIRRSV
jgi:hypothetical protein